MKVLITEEQKNKSHKYHKLSKDINFDFVIEDLEKQLESERKKTHRINDKDEMFRINHTLNGFENAINYIKTQIKLYQDLADNKIGIKVKKDE